MDRSKLRSHQVQALVIAERYADGRLTFAMQKFVLASITPGGGKTLMALCYADVLLAAGLVKQVVVIVPNDALRLQLIEGFRKNHAGIVRGLRKFKAKTSRQQDAYDRSGFVVTYQAATVVDTRRSILKAIKAVPTLLILDEPHHLADRGDDDESVQWFHAIASLVEAAAHVLLMSGTLLRHDKARIPFVKYDDEKRPDPDIIYTRKDGLRDGAIIPVEYERIDADSLFKKGNTVHDVTLSESSEKLRPAALRTVLESPDYREHMLRIAIPRWFSFSQNVAPSCCIVVCHSQLAAEAAAHFIRTELGHPAALAISRLPNAPDVIRDFRRGVGPKILVTVGMAYEGLDVPSATHLILLTATRSLPWLEQAVARVTRANPDPAFGDKFEQRAFVFVPDDPAMRDFVEAQKAEQDAAYEEREIKRREGGFVPRRGTLIALDVTPTDSRYSDSAGNLTNEQSALVAEVRVLHPELEDMPPRKILSLFSRLRGPGNGGSNDSGSGAAE